MAQKQIEDAYNNATPLERARQWPGNDAERRYSALCDALERKRAEGQVEARRLAHATEQVEAELRRLGVDPATISVPKL